MFQSIQRRNTVRNTWISDLKSSQKMKYNYYNYSENNENESFTSHRNLMNTCYAFIVGQPTQFNSTVVDHVLQEQKIHNDIIFLNHTESYFSLTEKSFHSFLRVYISMKRNNLSADYIFKIDDDAYVDISVFLEWVETNNETQHINPQERCLYAGYIDRYHKPLHIRTSKYSIWPWEWPYRYFRPFARGAGYVLSWNCISFLYDLCFPRDGSSQLPYSKLEDVTVGAALYDIPDLIRIHSPDITWLPECRGKMLCHHLSPSEMVRVHSKKINDENKNNSSSLL
eukprot:gb/GECH01001181.1/.p1 GENE.gb/GECH01001181.1/~~gb/GECH01001181.1/.p1  ORF type:complete len:283 (+),score=57.82 gb/GECH01001181.1/:1-849(+)